MPDSMEGTDCAARWTNTHKAQRSNSHYWRECGSGEQR